MKLYGIDLPRDPEDTGKRATHLCTDNAVALHRAGWMIVCDADKQDVMIVRET